jgi:DNA-binding beta-propeller fold protein YncE
MHSIIAPRVLSAAICAAATALTTSAPAGEVAGGNSGLQLKLSMLGRYDSGIRGASAAEIVDYDPSSQRLFIVNAQARSIDVVNIAQPAAPVKVDTLTESGGNANSVAVFQGLVAVAFEATLKTDPGKVVFYNAQTLARLAEFPVGALPDMVTFTPDGEALLVANEGEPNIGYTVDPVGSVSVIDLRLVENRLDGVELQLLGVVQTADFTAFNAELADLRAAGVRIYGPGASVAQDLEPEYIAVTHDGAYAWVSLQEANAVGVLDLADLGAPYFSDIIPLGLKDHNVDANKLDASDSDGVINIRKWPVKGLYQPDAIASYSIKGKTYFVLANEGDDRNDWINPGDETARVSAGAIALDPAVFGTPTEIATLKLPANLGRLTVTTAQVPKNTANQFTELHVLGSRSFSIRGADGALLFDSGDDFEQITAARYPRTGPIPNAFNASNDNTTAEDRSDNKGPEPEGVAVGKIRGRTFAFIGLERIGGIMTYDVTNPEKARWVDYVNTRNFSIPPNGAVANDAGPEGVTFISADESPNGKPLLVVGHEVSGTTVIYSIDVTGK